MVTIELATLEATRAFGQRLGSRLPAGAVVALVGPLGAGKTHLSRAIAEGIGLPDGHVVTSPTFVLIQEYDGGRLPVFHFDAYRLRDEAEFADLGAGEYFEARGVCLVEWADRVPGSLPADHLRIELVVRGPTARRAVITATGPRHEALLRELDPSIERPAGPLPG